MKKLFFILVAFPSILFSQLKISGNIVNKKGDYIDDVIMSIQDTSSSFYAEFILSKCEFNTKLSLGNFYIVKFWRAGYIQKVIYIDTGNTGGEKYRYYFDVEMDLIVDENKNSYIAPIIYFNNKKNEFTWK